MSVDEDRNDAMQKRNARRIKSIFAQLLREWELDAQQAMAKYGSLPTHLQDSTAKETYKYWKNVRSAMRWGQHRLRVVKVDHFATLPKRVNK